MPLVDTVGTWLPQIYLAAVHLSSEHGQSNEMMFCPTKERTSTFKF